MELTPGVLIAAAAVVAVTVLLVFWSRRQEASAPTDTPIAPGRSEMKMPAMGGRDPLVDWLLDEALKQTGVDVANDPLARQRITEAASKAMAELKEGESTTISLPFLTADAQGPKHFSIEVKSNRR